MCNPQVVELYLKVEEKESSGGFKTSFTPWAEAMD